MIEIGIPRLKDFYNPVLQAVHRLGGSGTRQEILDEVIRSSGLTEEQLEKLLVEVDGRESQMQYRVGYAQTHLKKAGFLENPSLGVWKLTDKGKAVSKVDPDEVSPRRKRPAVGMKQTERPRPSSAKSQPRIDHVSIPTIDKLLNPMLSVLHNLGGLGTNEEIDEGVAKALNLNDRQLDVLHAPEVNNRTEFAYRSSFARTYLKKYGLLYNPERKVWALTRTGKAVSRINPFAVILHAQRTLWEERLERERRILPDLTDINQTLI